MSWSINHAFKCSNNEFEAIRLLGAAGVASFIIGANAFQAWNMAEGRPFDVALYCTMFPAGLGAVLIAVAKAAEWKDKGVASAKVIAQTGAVPTPPAVGPQVQPGDIQPVENGT